MSGMLVSLYFFIDQLGESWFTHHTYGQFKWIFFLFLVYVIIAMFCMASSIALYSCIEPIVMWSYEAFPCCPKLQLPYVNLLICKAHLELRQGLLLIIAISVAVVWAVFRNEDWAWILQDFLGVMFW